MRFLTQNLWWKLFALVAAFGLWLNIASEPELATIVSVPVEYNNYPKDLEISSDIVETIDVEARGPSRLLRSLHDSPVAAIVDFGNVTVPGERTFTLSAAELSLPGGIDLIRTIPAQLRFKFERRATRTVSVDVPFSGTLREGLSIGQVEIEPPQLRVAGPESHVLQSKKLVSDPFDLTNVAGDAEQTLAVFSTQPEVRILSAPQVTVKIRIITRPLKK
jgi:YbbR domain-containing protein